MTRYAWKLFAATWFCAVLAAGQGVSPALFSGLRWRQVGPWRSGRVSAVSGAASRPNLYYIGTPGGGVFKTTDGGVVWNAVFDAPGADSVGAVALAPSDPQIVYVGTGEQLPGNGVWGSRDGGATWRHLGLVSARHIDALFVSPKDPSWVVIAAGQPSESKLTSSRLPFVMNYSNQCTRAFRPACDSHGEGSESPGGVEAPRFSGRVGHFPQPDRGSDPGTRLRALLR